LLGPLTRLGGTGYWQCCCGGFGGIRAVVFTRAGALAICGVMGLALVAA